MSHKNKSLKNVCIKVFIETYGCQMNKAESKAFQIEFNKAGWTCTDTESDADIVLLNTCSVRRKAEERIWGRLGHFRFLKKSKNFILVITGCMAERLKDKIKKNAPEVDAVIGNFQKHHLVTLCAEAIHRNNLSEAHPSAKSLIQKINQHDSGEYSFFSLHENNDFKAFVPIMHGCNNFCSYCIVPYVRGPEISRSPKDILLEIAGLEQQQVKEITLLGQNVNSYNFPHSDGTLIDFTGILLMILEKVHTIRWIRFLTSHPKDFPHKLIDVISNNPTLCRHIHLPLQHGSDKILRKMNRQYTISYYMKLIESIKKRISNVAITTDILIGFPGETEKDFTDTLAVMKEISFDDAFMYRYSIREGTKAASFADDVPEQLKLERLAKVIELQQDISRKKKLHKVQRIVPVLVERVSKKNQDELLGRTEKDEMVVFSGDISKINTFVLVKLDSLQGNTFKGREILCPGD